MNIHLTLVVVRNHLPCSHHPSYLPKCLYLQGLPLLLSSLKYFNQIMKYCRLMHMSCMQTRAALASLLKATFRIPDTPPRWYCHQNVAKMMFYRNITNLQLETPQIRRLPPKDRDLASFPFLCPPCLSHLVVNSGTFTPGDKHRNYNTKPIAESKTALQRGFSYKKQLNCSALFIFI